jgi:hypothetical protein
MRGRADHPKTSAFFAPVHDREMTEKNRTTDSTIRQIEFELEKAERGMAMPYDAERVGQLRNMLREARKRKLSEGLARRRGPTF